jgi:hypothetical protein
MNCHPQKLNQKLQIFQKGNGSFYWWAYNAIKSGEKMKKKYKNFGGLTSCAAII